MKKLIVLGIAAGLSMTSALPILAQDAPAATPPAGGVESPEGASAAEGGEITENYGTVVDAITAMSAEPDLSTITETSQPTIVLLSSLEGDENHDAAEVDAAITEHQAAVDALRAAAAGNDALVAILEQNGLSADTLIAVGQNADGESRIYVDDREP